jgi:hypothetical protein
MERFYDLDGRLIAEEEWLKLHSDMAYRTVCLDVFGSVRISTVWLGIDHSFGSAPPTIFETMVFGDPECNGMCWRYETIEEARRGHAEVVGRYSVVLRIGSIKLDT